MRLTQLAKLVGAFQGMRSAQKNCLAVPHVTYRVSHCAEIIWSRVDQRLYKCMPDLALEK